MSNDKPQTDLVHRFLFEETDIRGELVTLNTAFKEATSHQNLPIILKRLMGEFFAGTALLAETLKFEGLLSLQIRGEGPISLIMAETDHNGNMRGVVTRNENYSENIDDITDTDLQLLIGSSGVLTITVDPEKGQRYQGNVPLEGRSLGEVIVNYFALSEQIQTSVWLFANEEKCGGLMLQSLPPQEILDSQKRKDIWQTAIQLASTITEEEIFELEHNDILYRLFNEFRCTFFNPKNIKFHCSCTRTRSENALRSLGREDAYALLHERGLINIDCQFCGKDYIFAKTDLDNIFSSGEDRLH